MPYNGRLTKLQQTYIRCVQRIAICNSNSSKLIRDKRRVPLINITHKSRTKWNTGFELDNRLHVINDIDKIVFKKRKLIKLI